MEIAIYAVGAGAGIIATVFIVDAVIQALGLWTAVYGNKGTSEEADEF